jgi:hypothetical protein
MEAYHNTARADLPATRLVRAKPPSRLKTGATDRPAAKPELLIKKQPHLIVCLGYIPVYFNPKKPQSTPSDSISIPTTPPLENVASAPRRIVYLLLISIDYKIYSVHEYTHFRQKPDHRRYAKKIFPATFEYTKITRSRYTSNIRPLHPHTRKWRKSRQSIVVDSPPAQRA